MLAPTPPTQHRPRALSHVAQGNVTFYGKASRAVGVHSSAQDQRRQQRVARDVEASWRTLERLGGEVAPRDDCCQADAETAAAQLRALQRADHQVAVVVEERPT